MIRETTARKARWASPVGACLAMGATIGLAVALLAPAAALADRNFTPRFSENVPGGDIAIAATP